MSSGDQNYKEACSHYERGELGEAIELFTKAIDYYYLSNWENKNKVKAYYYRGCTFYRLGIQCERNQMFEESKENFEKALKDFEEVSEKIKELYPNKIKEIKEKFDDALVNFYVLYTEIDEAIKNEEKFYNALKKSIEFYEAYKENDKLGEIKEKFDDALIEFSEVCEEINNIGIKEKCDYVLKDIKEVSTKINELFSFNYYAGCTYYKLGMLYEKKRMNCKAHENFKNASTSLETASNGPYKENGKLWFYKGIANYKLKYGDSFEDFKIAVTYDYYDIYIFKKLLDIGAGSENCLKKIPLLYYLKKYSNITNDPDNSQCINCFTNLKYYRALSHYELKDFKKSFKLFNSLTKKSNNDLFSKKISSISLYYKGLIIHELRNNYKDQESLKFIKNKFYRVKVEDKDKSEFKKKCQEFVNHKDGKNLSEYISDENKVTKYVKYLNDTSNNEPKAGEILQKIFDVISQKTFEEALEKYNKILEEDNKIIESSQTFELYYDKALVLDELRRYKEAIESLDEFLKNKPRDAKAWLKKGTILFKIAKDEEIKTTFEETKTENENENEKSPCEKEITKIDAAKNALDKSIWYFNILIDENPGNPDHWYNMGTAHSSLAEVLTKMRDYQGSLNEYEEAVKAFDNATTLNPIFALAWNNKGNAYMKLKKYNKAIEAFEEASKINPNYYLALHNKGDAFYSLGRYDEAIKVYEQVIKQGNDNSINTVSYKSYNNKGLAYYKLGEYNKAKEAFDKAIEINPTFADALTNRGLVFYKLEMFSKAKKDFKDALELDPGDPRASNNLAVVLAREGELDQAKKLFENAFQENPNFILAHANLAELLLNSGGIGEASEKINNILKDDENPDPNMGYIHFLDGRIKIEDLEIEGKKYSEAAKSFEKAASFNVDEPTFLLWSVYAKYLCQKFETGGKANSSEESKTGEENIPSKTEDICSNELSNSIVSDLGKVLNFCNTPAIKKNPLPRLLNQNRLWEIVVTIIILYGLFYLFDLFEILDLGIQNASNIQLLQYTYLIAIGLILLIILFERKLTWPIIVIITTILLFGSSSFNSLVLSFGLLITTLLIILLKILDRRPGWSIPIIIVIILIIFFGTHSLVLSALIIATILLLILLYWIFDKFRESLDELVDKLKTVKAKQYLIKFNKYKEIKAYTLYLLGYFYFKLQDYTTAKEKLQECINLRPDAKTNKAASELLDNIWKHKIKPPFWTYWFNSPVNTWRRRSFGTFLILGILLILFVHMENPQPVDWNNSTSKDYIPSEINFYPYIISYYPANNTSLNIAASVSSNNNTTWNILTPANVAINLYYPANNTTSNPVVSESSNNNTTLNILTPAIVNIYLYNPENNTTSNPAASGSNNNNTTWNILIPASVNIYPDIPDNFFDAILLLILILILISPSVRITETVKIVLKKGGDVSLDLGPIAAPPEFNFELSPSLMLDVIKRLDENL